jgi:hypothetical protein
MCQRDAGGDTLRAVEHLSQICAMQVAESPHFASKTDIHVARLASPPRHIAQN